MPRMLWMTTTALGGLLLAACSSAAPAASPTSTAAAGTTATATTATAAPKTGTAAATSAAPTGTSVAAGASATPRPRVSANNATREQLQAAFEAVGITGASGWAREVVEYRPYPADDANLPKLRQNLVKYNPGPGVVDAIVATLSLP